jgi:hypothetical protein
LARGREPKWQAPKQQCPAEQVGDELDIGVRAQLASFARLDEARKQRLASRTDDSICVDIREDGVLLKLPEDADQEPALQRIRERACEVAEPGQQQRVEIVRAPVDVRRQLA